MASELLSIPGVGKDMAEHFNRLGIYTLADLKGQNAEELYAREQALCGPTDRCVLYVYRLAVAYAAGRVSGPEQLRWWNWKD